MNLHQFLKRKNHLVNSANDFKAKHINQDERESLDIFLNILSSYTYENRLKEKGRLTHAIIDSLNINEALAAQAILFDKELS